jgi:hypothetical protein
MLMMSPTDVLYFVKYKFDWPMIHLNDVMI